MRIANNAGLSPISLYTELLAAVVADNLNVSKADLCSRGKSSHLVEAKEVFIISGRRLGATLAQISDALGINASTVSRRHDAAKRRMVIDQRMSQATADVIRRYKLDES